MPGTDDLLTNRRMDDPLTNARGRAPLTDRDVRGLAPASRPIDIRDSGMPGLILTILPSARKQWTVRYRIHGKQRRLILGEYPGLSLARARKRARKALTDIDGGSDPAGELQTAKHARTDTVDALATEYLAKHARKKKRSADEDERILNLDVLPHWRTRSVRELTRRDVRVLIERVAERAPVMANRTLAVVRKMLNFAVDHDWIDANPAARIEKPAQEKSRDRVLTPDEIRRVWRILSNLPTTADRPAPGRARKTGTFDDPLCPVSAPLAALLKARLMLAQRGGETARMRWADVDLDNVGGGWWTIPSSDTKNGEPHRVPLPPDAVALIRAQQPDPKKRGVFVFTSNGEATTLDRAKKAPALISRALGFEFRGHDFRRTAATGMAEAGIPREHIAYVLNHVEGSSRATKIYDRYSRDAEKRVALETWARRLKAILEDKAASAVVSFTKGA